MSEGLIFDVSASAVRAVASCTIQDFDIRHYLQGVYVEPREGGGVYIVATNGHCMMAIFDPSGHATQSVIARIDKSMRKALPKRAPNDDAIARLQLRTLQDGQHMLHLPLDGGKLKSHVSRDIVVNNAKYPDWRRVMKGAGTACNPVSGIINAMLLSAMAKGLDGQFKSFIAHQIGDELSAVHINFTSHPDIIGIVMPMRDPEDRMQKRWSRRWKEEVPEQAAQPSQPAQDANATTSSAAQPEPATQPA
jgi:hypothetical protein